MLKKERELNFNDWLESIVFVDEDKIPISPSLVPDEDEGEDMEEEK